MTTLYGMAQSHQWSLRMERRSESKQLFQLKENCQPSKPVLVTWGDTCAAPRPCQGSRTGRQPATFPPAGRWSKQCSCKGRAKGTMADGRVKLQWRSHEEIGFQHIFKVKSAGCSSYSKQLYYSVAVSNGWFVDESDGEILALRRLPSSGSIAIMH